MKCSHCGRENKDGDICKSCGAILESENPANFFPPTDALYWYSDTENGPCAPSDYRTEAEKLRDDMIERIESERWYFERLISYRKDEIEKLERKVRSLSTVVYVTISAASLLLFVILMLQ